MKKTITLIVFLVLSTMSYGQSFFDKLEDMDGVDAVVVTKDAFEILSKFKSDNLKDNKTMKVFQMIKELKELKMFSTDKPAIENKMEAMVKEAITQKKLTELMRVKDDDSRVKIYVKASKNKDYVSEVLMFIKQVNLRYKENKKMGSVLISLTGNIDINKMSELADTFTGKKR